MECPAGMDYIQPHDLIFGEEQHMKEITLKNGQICTLRDAEKKDAQAIMDYLDTVCAESDFLSFGPGEFGMDLAQEEAFLEAQSKQENALFILAEVDGKIIGNINFTGGKRPRMQHVGAFGISVLKEYWGMGLGQELIAHMIHWAKEHGIRKINLAVRTDNDKGVHLYKKMGFKEEGVSEREQCVKGIFYDCILMGMKVDP